MEKEVFEQSLDEMLEMDTSLDINSMLDSIPAIETIEETKKEDEKVDTTLSLDNINKVLDKQSKESVIDEEETTKLVEEKIDDNPPVPLEQSTKETSDAPFTVIFARDLVEQGVLSSFDEAKFLEDSKEVGEAEALRNILKSEILTNIEAAKSDLDSGYQEYLKLVGKGVPTETASSLVELKTKFDSIKDTDISNEENTDLRKQIITDYFKLTTSMSDNKIEKLVQNSIDLGEDVDDAKEYHSTLKKLVSEQVGTEEKRAAEVQALQAEENKRSIELLKDNINSLVEIIPGVNINKQTKNQMFEAITKPIVDDKGRTTNAIWAKRAEDPMFFDERISYLYATGYFEKGKTWNKASQAKTTKEISALEKALQNKNNTESRVGAPVLRDAAIDKTSKDNIDSMRGIFG